MMIKEYDLLIAKLENMDIDFTVTENTSRTIVLVSWYENGTKKTRQFEK